MPNLLVLMELYAILFHLVCLLEPETRDTIKLQNVVKSAETAYTYVSKETGRLINAENGCTIFNVKGTANVLGDVGINVLESISCGSHKIKVLFKNT